MMPKGRNDNHPKRGSSIKVQPIRSLSAIQGIKDLLKAQPRNLCLFTLGINTAYRANELLSLTVGQVEHLRTGDVLEIKQSKNNQYRQTVVNAAAEQALRYWLDYHPQRFTVDAPLFLSQRRKRALTVAAVNRLVKLWCQAVMLAGNYGSHSLRKTWGYHQRIHNEASVALLMRAFGHTSEAQTLAYLGILPDEIRRLYLGWAV